MEVRTNEADTPQGLEMVSKGVKRGETDPHFEVKKILVADENEFFEKMSELQSKSIEQLRTLLEDQLSSMD